MNYFLGSSLIALALIVHGAACSSTAAHCDYEEECPCVDGTDQVAGCTQPAATCTDACSNHGGVVVLPTDGGDGG